MFVYQNKAGHVCVTFADNKPVETPEYVIAIDEEAKALYMVSGTIEAMPEQDDEEVAEEAVDVKLPKVEELDDVVENDAEAEVAPIVDPVKDAPAMDDLRETLEGEAEDDNEKAPVTEADSTGVPSIEELDDVVENDPAVVEEEDAPVAEDTEADEE